MDRRRSNNKPDLVSVHSRITCEIERKRNLSEGSRHWIDVCTEKTRDAYVMLALRSNDPLQVELKGFSESDWAGDPLRKSCKTVGTLRRTDAP